jgi:hypothetical protein
MLSFMFEIFDEISYAILAIYYCLLKIFGEIVIIAPQNFNNYGYCCKIGATTLSITTFIITTLSIWA